MKSLAQQYDCLLVDLDGTVFRGHRPTEGAVEALDDAGARLVGAQRHVHLEAVALRRDVAQCHPAQQVGAVGAEACGGVLDRQADRQPHVEVGAA